MEKKEDSSLIWGFKLRNIIQLAFILFLLYIGQRFYSFMNHFTTEGATSFVQRPPSVEAFLPISALIALKSWVVNQAFDTIHPAGLTIFLAILLISFLYRRGFCSWICPIGAVSEAAWTIGKRIFGRNPTLPRYLDLLFMLPKYLILIFFLKVVLFDMGGDAAAAFLNTPYNKIADVKMLEFWIQPSITTIKIVAVLVALSLLFKNFWCRYLCPYGALLGLTGFLSPVRISRDRELCIDCKACSRACPNQIKVDQKLTVGSVECTSCLACIESCRPRALSLKIEPTKNEITPEHYSLFLLGTFFLVIFLAKATGHWDTALEYEDYKNLIPLREMLSH